jgi:hypothetical protein
MECSVTNRAIMIGRGIAMIFTFNARGNIFWEVMTDRFALSPSDVYQEISHFFPVMKTMLRSKRINYDDLKNCLTPQLHKKELLLVFDSTRIDRSWYAQDVWDKILPLFTSDSSHSVLTGDYIDIISNQRLLHNILLEELEVIHECKFQHSSQFFCVYINNLADTVMDNIVNMLEGYEPFFGFVDMTFSSGLKEYISHILGSTFIKHKKKIIMSHGPDPDNIQNENFLGYAFEENGFECYSLPDIAYNTFLSYKIERNVIKGFERDNTFGLNTITADIHDLNDLNVLVEDKKLEYLLSEKTGKFKKANLIDITKDELELLIQEKIKENYLFNLVYLEQHHTYKFNLALEFEADDRDLKVKMILAFEYLSNEKLLRLITMY